VAVARRTKFRPWHADAATLARLRQVEHLHLQRVPQAAIAQQLGVSVRTVRRDIARCEQLWREHAAEDVVRARARLLRQLDAVLAHATAQVAALEVLRKTTMDRARVLGLVAERPAAPELTLPQVVAWLHARGLLPVPEPPAAEAPGPLPAPPMAPETLPRRAWGPV
jgi:hypothetical protein